MPKGLSSYDEYNKLTPDQKELHLMVTNSGKIRHENQYNSINKNYEKKVKSGKYDFDLSIKGYKNLVSNVRRDPEIKEIYKGTDWKFNPSDDQKVAKVYALEFYEENKKAIQSNQKSKMNNGYMKKDNLYKMEKKGLI
tara:strand:+ start:177 stop:590 length:414 start_codon:yes stop_codon:yes gene_type:complete